MTEESDQTSSNEPLVPPQPQPQPPPAAVPPPPRRRFNFLIPISCAIGCLPWLIILMVFFVAIGVTSHKETTAHVALIRVTGVISSGSSGGGLMNESTAGAEDLVAQLEKARRNKKVKAIVLRINSPGGSAAGSEEVYNEVMRIRKAGKPVYTSMGDVAASGGYFIASACDKIYADACTLTGSIGVIFSLGDLSELYKKIGYQPEVIKSGKFKDIGSSSRALTNEERQMLQTMVMQVYDVFLNAVAQGRNMPVSEIRPIADGRILTGQQAVKLKLVDEIGDLQQVIIAAARAGGIKGKPDVVEYERKSLLESIISGGPDESASLLQRELAQRAAHELLRRSGGLKGLE